jgi:dolichol-phosphate mannosyltransferase
MYKISLAAPAYNEADGLEKLIDNWQKYLESNVMVLDYEICICNDNSTDDTLKILTAKSQTNKNIKFCTNNENLGAAHSLSNAVKLTSFDWVFLIDSDDQYPIMNLDRYLQVASPEIDAVIGYRTIKQDTLFMRFGSKVSSFICNKIYNTHYKDFNCALKLIKKTILNKIKIDARGLNYSADYLAKLIEINSVILEVEAIHQSRKSGKSSAKILGDSWRRVLFISFLWFKKFLKSNNVIQ